MQRNRWQFASDIFCGECQSTVTVCGQAAAVPSSAAHCANRTAPNWPGRTGAGRRPEVIELSNAHPADDHEAIRSLVHRYCDAVSTGNEQAWIETWADDAIWDIGRGECVGRDAILAAYRAAIARFEHVVQLSHNGSVAIEGPAAHGRWYISEFGRSVKGKSVLYICHYDDEYRKSPEGWQFTSTLR